MTDIERSDFEKEDYIYKKTKYLASKNKKFEQDIKVYKIMKDKNAKNKLQLEKLQKEMKLNNENYKQ